MNYTVKEYAQKVGKSPRTIRKWIKEGKLQAKYIGGWLITDDK